MSIESADDWKGLRRAGRIAHLTLEALEARVRPGMTTAELDAVAARVFAAHGARSAPAMVYGFPGTVLISVNDEVVHGIPGPRRLEAGDLVKLDVTVEKDGYVADAARTVIVESGSDVARRLAACARAAFAAALDGREGGHQGQRDQPRGRARSAEARVHRRARADRPRRGPRDSRAAVGAESLRPVAARRADRRARADHRADHQRGIGAHPRRIPTAGRCGRATAVCRRITSTRWSSRAIGRSC